MGMTCSIDVGATGKEEIIANPCAVKSEETRATLSVLGAQDP
jgi:hypothetical protein